MQVKDARRILTIEEANKLIDADEVAQEAINRAEQSGIILLTKSIKLLVKKEILRRMSPVKGFNVTFYQL